MMACPYDARVFHGVDESYHAEPSAWEEQRYKEHALGVVDKCDFCKSRIVEGLAAGLTPGADPNATPVCVGACIAAALVFGDPSTTTAKSPGSSRRAAGSNCSRR